MVTNLHDLYKLITNIPRQKIAVVSANDDYVLDAIDEAYQLGVIYPILIGPKEAINNIIATKKYTMQYEIVDVSSDIDAANKAVEMVRNKQADIIMKGLLDTKVLLKAVVNSDKGIKESNLLSHVALISYSHHQLFFVTDAAMVINPTVEEKVGLIENAVSLAKTLGYDLPKVGLVSAVEKVNPKMQSTVDAQNIVNLFKQGQIKDCIVDGPFAIDNLVSLEAVKHKNITSEVAGKADVLVFPNIESANVFYKTSVFLGGAEVAGIILGATNPIVLTSRADSSQSKLNSILLAVVYNYGKNITHY